MNFNFSSSHNSRSNGNGNGNCSGGNDGEDYYKLLEVSRDASFDEIKKSYRKLSMIHHPDKNGNSEESTIKFKQLANAYETLSDEDKRTMYDMGIRNGNMGGGTMPFDMNINPFDIFNMIFGSHQQQQQQQQQNFNNFHDFGTFIKFGNGKSMGMPMSMSMPMGMSMPMPMPMGMGIHIIHPEQMEHAHMFDIRQPLRKEQEKQQQQQQQQQQQDKCDIYITLEDAYNGIENYVVKMRDQEQPLCVCIPPGVSDKETIIITTSKFQMVHIIVNIKPHELFQRNGLDLIFEKEISFKESLCGLEFSIKHVNGKTFHLQHKDGTIIKDGVSKTIQRLGLKDGNDGVGALIIVFKVVYPNKLSKQQIEKLSEIL
jgi:DnaJ-class molecular chaperone